MGIVTSPINRGVVRARLRDRGYAALFATARACMGWSRQHASTDADDAHNTLGSSHISLALRHAPQCGQSVWMPSRTWQPGVGVQQRSNMMILHSMSVSEVCDSFRGCESLPLSVEHAELVVRSESRRATRTRLRSAPSAACQRRRHREVQ